MFFFKGFVSETSKPVKKEESKLLVDILKEICSNEELRAQLSASEDTDEPIKLVYFDQNVPLVCPQPSKASKSPSRSIFS